MAASTNESDVAQAQRETRPGPPLDALVAQQVMGWTLVRIVPTGPDRGRLVGRPPGATVGEQLVPTYSADRAAALDVYFEMVTRLGHAEIHCDMEEYGREPGDIVTVILGLDETWWYSGLLPEAICRAALEAVRGKNRG